MWCFSFEKHYFFILSGNRRGTTVEGNTTNVELIEGFIDIFIKDFENLEKFKQLSKLKMITPLKSLGNKIKNKIKKFKYI